MREGEGNILRKEAHKSKLINWRFSIQSIVRHEELQYDVLSMKQATEGGKASSFRDEEFFAASAS